MPLVHAYVCVYVCIIGGGETLCCTARRIYTCSSSFKIRKTCDTNANEVKLVALWFIHFSSNYDAEEQTDNNVSCSQVERPGRDKEFSTA